MARNIPLERKNERRARIGMDPYVAPNPADQDMTQASLNWLMASQIPGVADVAGLVSDAKMYANDEESRNFFNYGLTLLSILPFVPAPSLVKEVGDIAERAAKEVPGMAKVNKFLTDEEKALFDTPRWKNAAENTVKIYKQLPTAKELADVALAGGAKRGWYQESFDAIENIFANPQFPDDPQRFTALLAALSPQTSVESNLKNALATWGNWIAAGRPRGEGQILDVLGRSVEGDKGVESVLGAWRNNSFRALTAPDARNLMGDVGLSGPKVQSFSRNLAGDFNEVTNDAWMSKLSSVDQGLFGGITRKGAGSRFVDEYGALGIKGPGYLAQNALTREAAGLLGWTPAEIQETAWSFGKTLSDLSNQPGYVVKGLEAANLPVPQAYREMKTMPSRDVLSQGLLTDAAIGSTPAFGDLMSMDPYRGLLEGAGYTVPAQSGRSINMTSPYDRIGTSPGELMRTPSGRNIMRSAGRLDKLQRRSDALSAIDRSLDLQKAAKTDTEMKQANAYLGRATKQLQRSVSELPNVPLAPAYRGLLQ